MVCDRCISTVNRILNRLDLTHEKIFLGQVLLSKPLSPGEKLLLQKEFEQVGFELIADKNEMLVSRIKSIVIKHVYQESYSSKNLSILLTDELPYDYSHLSSLFSKIEGKSIQAFQFLIKTERIKELLEYNEKSISEIASLLGFGSAAYLSTAFKKATGITPSQYREERINGRNTLNSF